MYGGEIIEEVGVEGVITPGSEFFGERAHPNYHTEPIGLDPSEP